MCFGYIGTSQHHDVGIRDFLLLVCQCQELLVDLVYLMLIAHIHTIDHQAMLQSRTT